MSRPSLRLLAIIAGSSLIIAACGEDGNDIAGPAPAESDSESDSGSGSGPRTVEITMNDIVYEPTAVTVSEGETIRFVFTNDGAIRHEAVFGDTAVQDEHEAEMAAGDMDMDSDMDMDESDEAGHDEAGDGDHDESVPSISLAPGATGEIEVTFDADHEMIIGCHEPGHWAAGMRIDVTVEA
jgi:uncharacterized cupredoxin-like copper-binding protein